MKRILFVVSRKQPDLVARLEQQCRGGSVEIILDRRHGDRRKKSDGRQPERRRVDRRKRSNSSELELIGIAVAVLPS